MIVMLVVLSVSVPSQSVWLGVLCYFVLWCSVVFNAAWNIVLFMESLSRIPYITLVTIVILLYLNIALALSFALYRLIFTSHFMSKIYIMRIIWDEHFLHTCNTFYIEYIAFYSHGLTNLIILFNRTLYYMLCSTISFVIFNCRVFQFLLCTFLLSKKILTLKQCNEKNKHVSRM